MDRLVDKVAFITGAGAGIGRASAILFGSEGARIAVADVDQSGGQETARLVNDKGGQAIYVKADVTNPESIKDAVRKAIDKFGKLDIIYSNAGGSVANDGPVTEVSIEVWEKTHSVDLFGTFLCCKYGIPELIENGGGSVILTSSLCGVRGSQRSAYSSAKGAIISLTRVMAVDYARYNIRVNCLCPGLIITERIAKQIDKSSDMVESLRPLHLFGFGEPIDIAYAALYLASNESKMVTGVALSVDSGFAAIGRIDKKDLLEKPNLMK